jgi:exopolyphosphatase/guanosine-5'-triphosphate,3'-diphosphate pyrophosphatase
VGTDAEERNGKVVSFIDIGTNSVRLLVVRLGSRHTYTVLREEKVASRLGEGEFKTKRIHPSAMRRTVLVCKNFADLARALGSTEIHAMATAAAREARNRLQLLARFKREAGLDVKVVSGKEEARLIYLGVVSGVQIGDDKALFVDIGGGSTELVVGDQSGISYLDSMGLGAIRLTTMYLKDGGASPVDDDTFEYIKRQVVKKTSRTLERFADRVPRIAFGSSGTIINLATIARRMGGHKGRDKDGDKARKRDRGRADLKLSLADLKRVGALLRSKSLAERRRVEGINPERADIIVAGEAILEAIMEELGIDEIIVSERSMLHGMLMDYLSKQPGYPQFEDVTVRDRSVLQLGMSLNLNEPHTIVVSSLALQLFDSAKKVGLHDLGRAERELLRYAAYLHDVGDFISFRGHHLHSYYIISNAELLGFDQAEVSIIANIARFHRKRLPRRGEATMADLDHGQQEVVRVLSTILRLAESMDRSHMGRIARAELGTNHHGRIVLSIWPTAPSELEVWGLESDAQAFRKVFGEPLKIKVMPPA